MKKTIFKQNGNWYKGNLHCHSTVSDGALTPKENVAAYRNQGYSFLAFTEHEAYTDRTDLDSEDFIVLPGIERSIQLVNETYHINGIGDFSELGNNRMVDGQRIDIPQYQSLADVQGIIDQLKDSHNLVMINHPYWSFNSACDISKLDNFDLLEIFNTGCEREDLTGDSSIIADELYRGKKKFNVAATDDNHNRNKEIGKCMWDSFGGYVWVQAEELSRKAITQALKEGNFYASCGPQFKEISLDGNEITVKCSPVKAVYFYSYPHRGYSRQAWNGTLEECTYTMKNDIDYIRIVLEDEDHQKAYSNPIYLK